LIGGSIGGSICGGIDGSWARQQPTKKLQQKWQKWQLW
jgi:hypothetical protein